MKSPRLAFFSWTVLTVNVFVILWGAFVRATSSGAGCGSHWPLCNGEVIPQAPHVKTIIEFTHRLTSGLALMLVILLAVWVWKAFEKGSLQRRLAGLSVFFIFAEAGIGAGLVLLRLVGQNASFARAVYMSLHLVNTYLLLGALALTAWTLSSPTARQFEFRSATGILFFIGVAGMLLLGVSGAITALGDTLFPVSSLAEGWRQDVSPTSHFLLKLRVWHPIIAVSVGIFTLFVGGYAVGKSSKPSVSKPAFALKVLVLAQLAVGVINVALLAPTWMQIVHLFFADAVWVAFLLLGANSLASEVEAGKSESAPIGGELQYS